MFSFMVYARAQVFWTQYEIAVKCDTTSSVLNLNLDAKIATENVGA